MLTLFGMATKDDAVCMVHACMLETDCDEDLGECGDAVGARIFYILFDFTIMVSRHPVSPIRSSGNHCPFFDRMFACRLSACIYAILPCK
jgi:hypothetical protein